MSHAIRWAFARWVYRRGLPWSWIAPRWTVEEIEDNRKRARERMRKWERKQK